MEREINLKYLLLEIAGKWKVTVLVGIVLALVFGAVSWFSMNNQTDSQTYASRGKVYIKKNVDNVVDIDGLKALISDEKFEEEVIDRIDSKIDAALASRDVTDENISFMTSDEVLNKVVQDSEIKDYNLSVNDVRNNLYLRGKSNGSVIEINAVTDNQELADLICTKVIDYGTEYLITNDYKAEVVQDASSLGTVSVELRESSADPRDKNAIITAVASEGFSVGALMKKFIMGFIAGIFIMCVFICGIFILRDRISYKEQIGEVAGMELLGVYPEEKACQKIYSSLAMMNSDMSVMSFAALKPLRMMDELTDGFAEILGKMSKKVLIIESCSEECSDKSEWSIQHSDRHDLIKICDEILLDKSALKEKLNSLKTDYDYIVLKCNDVDGNPASRVLSGCAACAVMLIEARTVSVKDACHAKDELVNAGVEVAGTVFVGKIVM